jgi:hypothetical protein
MRRTTNEVFDGQNWIPWIGLAMVVPPVIVLLIGVFGITSGGGWRLSGNVSPGAGSRAVSIAGAAIAAVLAFGALMLGLVGLVRGLRRSPVHNGRSVGIAGFTMEIGIILIAALALGFLLIMLL